MATAPIPVPLRSHFDNAGFARAGEPAGSADFDGVGHALPAEELPPRSADGVGEIGGVPYLLAEDGNVSGPDNVVARGQRIDLPPIPAHSALLLGAGSVARPIGTGSSAAVSGVFTVVYTDGTTSSTTLTAPGYLGPGGVFEAGYRYRPDGSVEDEATVSLWSLEVPLIRPGCPPRSFSRPQPTPRQTRWSPASPAAPARPRPDCTSSRSASSRSCPAARRWWFAAHAARLRCSTALRRPSRRPSSISATPG